MERHEVPRNKRPVRSAGALTSVGLRPPFVRVSTLRFAALLLHSAKCAPGGFAAAWLIVGHWLRAV